MICLGGVCRAFEEDVFKMVHVKWVLGIRGSLNDLILAISRVRCSYNIMFTYSGVNKTVPGTGEEGLPMLKMSYWEAFYRVCSAPWQILQKEFLRDFRQVISWEGK